MSRTAENIFTYGDEIFFLGILGRHDLAQQPCQKVEAQGLKVTKRNV